MPTYKKLGSKRTPGLYTFEEAQLIELYNQYSDRTDKWKIIAAKLNRTHQSVRGQYVNHLDESIMNLYGGEHIGYGSCYESYGGGGHIDYGSCYESYTGGYGIN
ncbi:12635_t:CDS:2 [Rhizophagus irregularis]|nr:12635_t:CDS:2 [Rhizophagus irregularis]